MANAYSHHSRTSTDRFQEAGLQRICAVQAMLLEGVKKPGKRTVARNRSVTGLT